MSQIKKVLVACNLVTAPPHPCKMSPQTYNLTPRHVGTLNFLKCRVFKTNSEEIKSQFEAMN